MKGSWNFPGDRTIELFYPACHNCPLIRWHARVVCRGQIQIVSDQGVNALRHLVPCHAVLSPTPAQSDSPGAVGFLGIIRTGESVRVPAFAIVPTKKSGVFASTVRRQPVRVYGQTAMLIRPSRGKRGCYFVFCDKNRIRSGGKPGSAFKSCPGHFKGFKRAKHAHRIIGMKSHDVAILLVQRGERAHSVCQCLHIFLPREKSRNPFYGIREVCREHPRVIKQVRDMFRLYVAHHKDERLSVGVEHIAAGTLKRRLGCKLALTQQLVNPI